MRGAMKKAMGSSLVAAVTLAVLSAPPAYSGAVKCRSDPTVLLSNGTELDLSADIGDWLWNVTAVSYTIHVPQGVGIVAVIRTPDWPTAVEHFSIVADAPAKTYQTTTMVNTSKGASVTANLLVRLQFATRSGLSGQSIPVSIKTP
jgi:hypothetical protein